ncbi:hypothetical protein HII36_43070 [Nonomuraea sp. NN258]|uniref:hypothetical protein n=1 Tax=Nonomuraea antri TaxID=2730852 RepID=UPI001569CBB2|nr:hypothetical protein [Nonomuraea antri]NRQ38561.1 hypothetical protein [Nonomuraea antri]
MKTLPGTGRARPLVVGGGIAVTAGLALTFMFSVARDAAPASGGTPPGGPPAASAPPSRPMTVEELADTAGCVKRSLQTDAAELRQGACQTGRENLTIVTFASEQGKRAWLDYAQMYGGTYLVGSRWVVVGPAAPLMALQGKAGGAIESPHHGMHG